jgi:arylsulfatase A-like enzyme
MGCARSRLPGRAARARGVVAALASLAGLLACAPEPDPPPNLVLIVIDTARADHFSSYGYPRQTTPRFDAFARQGVRFERAYSTSTWTLPAHASLFTGLLPATHGATQQRTRLDGELETLAELVAARGYRTASFSNNAWISRTTGMAQGFDHVDPRWRDKSRPERDGLPHPTNRAIFAWLDAQPGGPFFLFVNFMEPHWPFRPPPAWRARFVRGDPPRGRRRRAGFPAVRWYSGKIHPSEPLLSLRADLYDADLAYADAALGELLDGLAARDLLDASVVVVTADHGENLGDRGHQGHSFALYDSTVRVPLAIRRPGGESGRVRTDPVQLPDVAVTLAAAAGVAFADPRVVGRDLSAGPLPESRPLVAQYAYPATFLARFPADETVQRAIARYRRELRALRVGDEKLIWASDGDHELYDLAADPVEARDRSADDPARVRALEAELEALLGSLERAPTPDEPGPLDEDVLENLRAVGYVK